MWCHTLAKWHAIQVFQVKPMATSFKKQRKRGSSPIKHERLPLACSKHSHQSSPTEQHGPSVPVKPTSYGRYYLRLPSLTAGYFFVFDGILVVGKNQSTLLGLFEEQLKPWCSLILKTVLGILSAAPCIISKANSLPRPEHAKWSD